MTTHLSRRTFLKMVASTSAVGLLAACGGNPPAVQTAANTSAAGPGATAATGTTEAPVATQATAAAATVGPTLPPPTPTPLLVGQGNTPLTMWVQDFAPAVQMFQRAAKGVADRSGNIKVTVQPIPYTDLLAKVLPSVAAGTEANIIMGYTDWYVATDVSKLFLELDEIMGGRSALEKIIFPSALTTLDTPQNKVYYVPWAAGIRAAATTVNINQYKEKNLDYTKFAVWEDFVQAGKQLTIKDGDRLKRSGLSPINGALSLLKCWIWQQGGEFYDAASGKWSFSTPDGETAAQRLYDLFYKDQVVNFDLFTDEYQGFSQGLVSTEFDGAWTAGVQEAAVPGLKVDVVPTPKLTGAKKDVVYPEHMGVLTLSRRLAQDQTKLQPATAILSEMLKPETLLALTETYSGSLMSKELYNDPRVMQTKYGPISKRVAEGTWPRTRYPKDHVANQGPAAQELTRGLRKEITIKEALTRMDTYLNQQEADARERLKS